jgi:hypothetical protein
MQAHPRVRILMIDDRQFADRPHRDARFLQHLAAGTIRGRFPGVAFAARKLPVAREHGVRLAFADQ